MRIEDAYQKLPEYIDGGLSAAERAEIERLLDTERELAEARDVSLRLDASLRDQSWITPSQDFTRNIMYQIELESKPRVRWFTGWWETARVVLSAAALMAILIVRGTAMAEWVGKSLAQAGVWVGSTTGYAFFAIHPVILIGLAAPLVAGGYATCVLTGRCRLSA